MPKSALSIEVGPLLTFARVSTYVRVHQQWGRPLAERALQRALTPVTCGPAHPAPPMTVALWQWW